MIKIYSLRPLLLAGFQNFRHASNALRDRKKSERARPGYRTFITVYWKDRRAGCDGRETLTTWLSTSWGNLITPPQLQYNSALFGLRPEGPDHLAQHVPAQSQSHARREACAAARVLQFMDATKLRPSKSHSRAFPGGLSSNAVPGRDHYSVWYDCNTKRYLFADEPYEAAADHISAERTAWAQRHGFVIAKPAWAGMYNPDGGSRLYLIADAVKGIQLEPIMLALDHLPEPIVEETWDGESTLTVPIFVSPGTIEKAEGTKLEQKLSRKTSGQRNSVGYILTFVGPQRRPKGRMPVEDHAEVGALLQPVLEASYRRKGVYNRVNAVRSELDEWVQREYNHTELPNQQFLELYYRNYHNTSATFSRSIPAAERDVHVSRLGRVKQILCKHYPDSPPLRSLLRKVGAAIKSMESWAP